MDIKDSVVLVTGGNRGLGKSLVQAFLNAGARKVYVGTRTLIKASDPRLHPIKLDVTNAQEVAAAAQECQDVNILVNNAGVTYFGAVLTQPLDQARNVIETNYFGALSVTQAFAPILKKNNGGALINILSVLSWFTSPFAGSAYSASKHAALSLTDAARYELRSQGTLVAGVFVGYMDTDMVASLDDPKANPDDVAARIVEGLRNNQEEIFGDQRSRDIKALIANNPQALYQHVQAEWDQAAQQQA
jgi:NAD(P)-dependent dehydrogenase (short-subunit alcohol dehydrogenase family)